MTTLRPVPPQAVHAPLTPPGPALGDRAASDLRFIRDTMERARSFTALPGWGGVTMGLSALPAAWLASRTATASGWLAVWLVEGALAAAIALWTMSRKARSVRMSLFAGPGWRFLLGLCPPLLAGAVMTAALYLSGRPELIPGTWLLLYGTAVLGGGAFSVRIVPVLGASFVALGVLALASSFVLDPALGDAWLATGFGGLHVGFGLVIARRYGG